MLDSGKAATDWTTLTADEHRRRDVRDPLGRDRGAGCHVVDWAAVSGNDIASPSSRYIQYRATLTSGAGGTTTPMLDSVSIAYNTDDSAPAVTIGGVEVTGTTARVSFSSAASDVARFECSLDGGAFATCASPRAVHGLDGRVPRDRGARDRSGGQHGRTRSRRGSAPCPTRLPPNVRVTVSVVRVTPGGLVKLRLSCPADETLCRVTVRLKLGARTFARKTLTITGGKGRTFTFKLRKSTLRRLVRNDRLKITVRVTARDAANNARVNSKRITLLEPKRR